MELKVYLLGLIFIWMFAQSISTSPENEADIAKTLSEINEELELAIEAESDKTELKRPKRVVDRIGGGNLLG